MTQRAVSVAEAGDVVAELCRDHPRVGCLEIVPRGGLIRGDLNRIAMLVGGVGMLGGYFVLEYQRFSWDD
jgi:hypothetical protein